MDNSRIARKGPNRSIGKYFYNLVYTARVFLILFSLSVYLQPRSVDVILEHDLVDQCKPGDRVQVVASLRCLPGKQGGYTTGTFRTILLANNIVQRGMVNMMTSKSIL